MPPDLDADARTVAHLAVDIARAASGPDHADAVPEDAVTRAAALLEQARTAVAVGAGRAAAAHNAAVADARASHLATLRPASPAPSTTPVDVPGGAPDAPEDAL